jgi:co-chaperonin GroES (HSP10)
MKQVSKLAFEPHKFNKEQFKPIRDYVFVSDMLTDERITKAGIIIPNDNRTNAGIRPRWCKVYKMGPEFTNEVKEGEWILVSHGRWSRGIEIEDEEGKKTLRRVDTNDILLVSDSPMEDETFSTKVF